MVARVSMTTVGSLGVFFPFLQRVDDTLGDFHEGGVNKVDGLCGFVVSAEDVAVTSDLL